MTAPPIDLDAFLAEQGERTTATLNDIASRFPNVPVGRAMRYALNGGGKRLRPALCVAAYRALRGEDDAAIQQIAAAIEIIHTYSLVHDDLPCMDDDSFRRGRETTHRVFGDRVAMLAGAALIPLAFQTAQRGASALPISNEQKKQIYRALADAAGAAGMVGGQVLDLEGHAAVTSADQLQTIHAAKTGALIAAACLIGAVAADATTSQKDAFERYGRHLGLAFQITDDVLDETASTADLGKTAGKDRDGGKATYPALLGLQPARARALDEAREAVAALAEVGLQHTLLRDLAAFAVERKR